MSAPVPARLALLTTVLGPLVILACAAPAAAQEGGPLAPGQWIRVHTVTAPLSGEPPLAGKFLSADSASLYVDPSGPQRRLAIARTAVQSLEVRTSEGGSAAGMRAGFLAGAATGVALGVYAIATGWDPGEMVPATIGFSLLLGGAGALVGSVVGFAMRPERWAPASLPAAP